MVTAPVDRRHEPGDHRRPVPGSYGSSCCGPRNSAATLLDDGLAEPEGTRSVAGRLQVARSEALD